MSPKNYDVEDELAIFFDQTSATREQCEDGARQLTKSSKVVPVPIQGVCSYTVYAGDDLEYVV